ncbi:MAG: hypothetical protein CMO44_18505 [Verrucomicrobiales bacterium]|nr:hypothetical protein [Verrucomicrobiales bacterium]
MASAIIIPVKKSKSIHDTAVIMFGSMIFFMMVSEFGSTVNGAMMMSQNATIATSNTPLSTLTAEKLFSV